MQVRTYRIVDTTPAVFSEPLTSLIAPGNRRTSTRLYRLDLSRRDMVATLLMDTIASDQVIDEAYAWLCERRKDYAPDADVWHGDP